MRNYTKCFIAILFAILSIDCLKAQYNITGFTPTSGAVGSIVTLKGSFSSIPAKNIVYFGEVQAKILTALTDEITVEVPLGATTNYLTYCLNNNYYKSTYQFITTYVPIVNVIDSTILNSISKLKFAYVPSCFATGDFDNDGWIDLIVGSNADTSVYVYKNKNYFRGEIDPTKFEKIATLKASISMVSLKVGDVDADGRLDIFVLNQNQNSLSVIKNISKKNILDQTSFSSKIDFTTGLSPIAMKLCDINNDYKLDVVVANYNGNTISVFQNKSIFGIFTQSTYKDKFDLPTGNQPIDVELLGGGIGFLVANYNSNTISVIQRKSSSYQLTYVNDTCYNLVNLINTKKQPFNLLAVDLNNDNKLEIIFTNPASATFSIIPNISIVSGLIFDTDHQVDFLTGNFPKSLAIADINGDAKPDILIGNASSGSVSIYQNKATTNGSINSTTISAKNDFLQGQQPLGVIVADFDNDGKPDFASLDVLDKQITFRKNTVGGTISVEGQLASISLNSGENSEVQSVTVSAKGLGINKVTITPSGANVQISTNQNSGFSTAPILLDPVSGTVANTIIYVKIMGATTKGFYVGKLSFTSPSVLKQELSFGIRNAIPTIDSLNPVSAVPGSLITLFGHNFGSNKFNVAVDFGGVKGEVSAVNDSVVTVKVPVGAVNTNVLLNVAGYQTYSPQKFFPVFANGNFLNQHCFRAAVNYYTSAYPLCITNADYNADGKQDIVFNHGNGLGFLTNKTTGPKVDSAFKNNNYLTLKTTQLIDADLDGDNQMDLVSNNLSESHWGAFRNISKSDSLTLAGDFEAQITFNTYGSKVGLATADLDLDGKIEVLTANNGTNSNEVLNSNTNNANTISIFKNNTAVGVLNSNSFKRPFELKTLDFPSIVVAGDLNGDLKPDVIAVNKNKTLSIFQNNVAFGMLDDNSFLPSFEVTLGYKPSAIEIVDMDLDGKNDIVFCIPDLGVIQVLINKSNSLNLSTTSFASPVNIVVGGQPHAFAIADFDGDALPDITVANYHSASVSLFKNISTGGAFSAANFQAKVDFAVGESPYDVKVVDIDGDGKPEIITSNSGGVNLGINLPIIGSSISVLHNIVKPNATGIEESRLNHISFLVYPNPAETMFVVKMNSDDVINTISLVDISGNEVLKLDQVGNNFLKISTENISKGLYMVKVVSSSGVGVQKILIH